MMQLDLYGTAAFTALLFLSTVMKVDATTAVLALIAAAVIWYRVKDWLDHQVLLLDLQERINKL